MVNYLISHSYLTISDDGTPVVETESRVAVDITDVQETIAALLESPGGRSGTTITLTVTPTSNSGISL